MKILFLSAYYPPHTRGGGEISTHLIAQGLRDKGHKVDVISDGSKTTTTMLDGVNIRRFPLGLTAKPLFERRHTQRIAKQLRDLIPYPEPYDIIHAHDFRSALVLAELGWKNQVVTVRDYAPICGTTNNILWNGARCHCTLRDLLRSHRIIEASLWRKPFRLWQYKYNISYRRQAFATCPHQIFISHNQQQEIAGHMDLSNIHSAVIYNPIPPAYISQPTVAPPGDSVLYVGTVEKYKGVELLLKAWREVVRSFPQAHLTIVGEGAQRRDYEQQIAHGGLQYQVTFKGRLPWERLRHIYDEAKIVVAPHLWVEPFGRTVVEAMARERLVIAANTGGPAEIIGERKLGFLFERGSMTDLVEKLTKALRLEKREYNIITNAARTWARHHLNPSTIAKQHEIFYQEVLSKR